MEDKILPEHQAHPIRDGRMGRVPRRRVTTRSAPLRRPRTRMAGCTTPSPSSTNTKSVVADSIAFARYLNKTYPDTPALIPAEADGVRGCALVRVQPIPVVYGQLRDKSKPYFREPEERTFERRLEDVTPAGSKQRAICAVGEVPACIRSRRGWRRMGMEADGKEKMFFMGDRISFAHIIVAGFVIWLKKTLANSQSRQKWY
ncbi:hypothetical protein C8Q76DRAFT_482511 [Earliella scabrosa]|nr:hypothetical protein C8Q76DRAFT_482511 [Earliella scabrosa]